MDVVVRAQRIAGHAILREREVACGAGGDHTGEGSNPLEHRLMKSRDITSLGIADIGQRNTKSEDAVRPKSDVDASEILRRPHHQAAHDEQHGGHRDLRDHEYVAHAKAARVRRTSARAETRSCEPLPAS